ncbi:patatin-like phospholipase family protein (plasmid) [Photobacterium sp. DA100]|uniref:patatin-like phospholipase family protein n=1 Tax=Photobacterium sp. DA100 TaxID=3027472 RepID=UPI002479ACA6|nr:patatin-like phospholipase family protein [Photobacterium sp. DA100]WEM44871.1 patatin-like phospholipase family protein [Photobacterium sp. DA100]
MEWLNIYRRWRGGAVLAFVGVISGTFSAAAAEPRPQIGLVLSGGGAKGAAHIGVLSVLEENRIPVDVITGTSMGAYVGGMYAMGLSAEEVRYKTMDADWQSGYEDRVGRNDLELRRKQQNDNYQIYTDIGIDLKGNYQSKPGAFQGQGMATLLGNLTDNLPALESFDELAVPYRAVATDIVTVQPVVLDRGHLATAMQASMTVPGALQPVRIGNQILVDGGIVNNMPVDAAQALGADVIIAVDLRDALFEEPQLNSAFNIIGQLTTFMTNTSADQQMALMAEGDVYLQPDVSFMLAPHFDKMDQAYVAGRKVALDALPRLQRYQLSEQDYQTYLNDKLDRRSRLLASPAYYIDRIEVKNYTQRSDQALLEVMDIATDRVITNEEMDEAVKRLNRQDIFERITYQIEQQDEENVLVMDVREKSWGPGYLNLKFAFEDDFANRSDFAFGTQYIYTNLTDMGGEWQFEWLLGSWKKIDTSFYFPLDYQKNTYTSFGISWNREVREFILSREQADLIDREPGSSVETEYSVYSGYAEWGWNLQPWSSLSVGYRGGVGEVSEININNKQDYTVHGPYVSFVYDDLDSLFFPREGFMLRTEVGLGSSRSSINDEETVSSDSVYAELKLLKPFSYERHSLVSVLQAGGYDSDDVLPVYVQDLGGLFNMSGYHRYELNGRYKLFGALVYSYRLMDNNFGAVSVPVYVGASLEQGGVWDNQSDIDFDSSLSAGSVFLGLDTPVGPVYLAYGMAEGGQNSFYLSLGTTFD